MSFFTIIVPVLQTNPIFLLFIQSLFESITKPSDIIFINDGSPLDIETLVEPYSKSNSWINRMLTIKHDKSQGCAKSINDALGLTCEDTDYLVFMDSDLILQDKWQNSLEEGFLMDDVGIVGGVLLYPQTGGIQCCGITYNGSTGRHLFLNENPDVLDMFPILEIQATVFAFCAVRYSAALRVGMLDEAFFNGYEDWDYQMRIRRMGFRSIIKTNIRHFHWEKSNGIHRGFNRKNNIGRFWAKHGDFIKDDLFDFTFMQMQNNDIIGKFQYQGIDLCELRTDAEQFWNEALRREFPSIGKLYDYSNLCGEKQSIWLPQILDSGSIANEHPFLFLCDNFVRLLDNQYWWNLRRRYCSTDVIIDLYGNIVSLEKLGNSFWPGTKIR